jgi:hypothetical protein
VKKKKKRLVSQAIKKRKHEFMIIERKGKEKTCSEGLERLSKKNIEKNLDGQ